MKSLAVATSCLSVLTLVTGIAMARRLMEWVGCPFSEDDRRMAAARTAALIFLLAVVSLVAVCQEV